jgi:hypothetical protein
MKHISYDKLSKKEKKKINNKKRGNWGDVNPVTRIVKPKKVYSRKEKHKGSANDNSYC